MRDDLVKKLTTGGVLAAAIVLLTTQVKIAMPLGYFNLGDAGVLAAGVLLGGGWGALCAGVASALSDVLAGYLIYAPATLAIKGAAALAVGLAFWKTNSRVRYAFLYLFALIVPIGYWLYETLLYGYAAALPNLPFNALQCLVGAAGAHALTAVLLRTKLFHARRESPACAAILREPKGGPDVVLVAPRAQAALIEKAADYLSVQGFTARLVLLDDAHAFDCLGAEERALFLPPEKPFVRVEQADAEAREVAQAARAAIRA